MLFCTETIFNPLYPAETRPNCSRICRTWTCSHHPADSFWKQVSFIKYLFNSFVFSPRPQYKRVNEDKEPSVHDGGQVRQQSPNEPVPKCLQHDRDNCERQARSKAWQQLTCWMIWCYSGKQRAPAPSLHMRIKGLSKFSTPAPGVYDPLVSFACFVFLKCVVRQQKGEKKTKSGSASYSFGLRPDRGRKEGPAPNAYSVETHKLGWEFYFSDLITSLSGRMVLLSH